MYEKHTCATRTVSLYGNDNLIVTQNVVWFGGV